jgi:hypothetical protein
MNVYAVIVTTPASEAQTGAAITTQFPDNFLKVANNAWFIADKETIFDFSKKLGLKDMEGGTLTGLIIIPVTFYWGHGSIATWQWLKGKLEEKVNA